MHTSGPAGEFRSLIDRAWSDASALESSLSKRLGHLPQIPGYEINHEIHRGGQGIVYRARQISTGRDVAIKIIRCGPFGGARERARFDREVQILGRLRHPNIAVIFDSGVGEGFHYFVMDFIPGESLQAYLDRCDLDLRGRLGLLAEISRTVHAAHQHGVIHRDLKPRNIVVDNRGRPNVVDFGLAKLATDAPSGSSESTEMTVEGQFLGSLPWSSPEQADGRLDDMDVRTDVYALGAIGYQIVTGRLPFYVDLDRARLVRDIVETDPLPPSAIRAEADDEIDTIILKCLAKAPEDRYQSALALADDLDRYLQDLPILARPPSAMCQIRKLVRRHKVSSAMAIVLLMTLVGFSVGMTVLYRKQVAAKADAHERRREAERSAATVAAVNDFLLSDVLASTAPENAQGRDLTLREILDDAARRIHGSLDKEPEVRASIQATIGRCYARLGLLDKAELHLSAASGQFEELFGLDDRRTLETQIEWAEVLHQLRRDNQALEVLRGIRQHGGSVLEADDPIRLRANALEAWFLFRDGKNRRALELLEQTITLAMDSSATAPATTVALLNDWNETLRRWAVIGKAGAHLQEALEFGRQHLGPTHPETLRAMTNWGDALTHQRRFAEAAALLEESFGTQREILGPQHPEVIRSAIRLCIMYIEANRLDEAESLLRPALQRATEALGPENSLTLDTRIVLTNSLMRQAREGEALKLIAGTYESLKQSRGEDDSRTIQVLDVMSFYEFRLGRYAEAESGFRITMRAYARERTDPADHYAAGVMRRLMMALAAQGKSEESRKVTEELLRRREITANLPDADAYMLNSYARDLLIAEPPDMRDPPLALEYALRARKISPDAYHYNRYTIARAYRQLGKYEAALPFIELAMDQVPLEDTIERRQYEDLHSGIYEDLGDAQAALRVYSDVVDAREFEFGRDHEDTAMAIERLATALMRFDRPKEAQTWLEDALEIRTRTTPQSNCSIGRTQSLMGDALLRQGLVEQAESRLLDGYGRMREDPYCSWIEIRAALRRIIECYETRGLDSRSEPYGEELSKLEKRMGISG